MRLNPHPLPAHRLALAAIAVAAGLAGCGGDSTPALQISGTAATGAPVVNGAVTATCKTGSGNAVTDAQGGFQVFVGNGEGPCLLKLVPASGGVATLYSMASGTSTSLTGNITTLTNLLVNYLTKVPITGATAPATPETWFQLPATQSLLAVPAAVDARIVNDFLPVITTLSTNGGHPITLTSTDFLRTPFSPVVSNPQDAVLETLVTATVVTSTGTPAPATTTTLTTAATDDTAVPPATTGTGGS